MEKAIALSCLEFLLLGLLDLSSIVNNLIICLFGLRLVIENYSVLSGVVQIAYLSKINRSFM